MIFSVMTFRSSSFAPAFWFLGHRRGSALAAVYAFARQVDDAVDEVGLDGGNPEEARRRLNSWRQALSGGDAPPEKAERVWKALTRALSWFPLDRGPLLELIDGVERDLVQTRYETAADTQAYCYGVAGTVGLACLPIFGLDPVRHRDFAINLGQAVQWVNILRDVKEDALRGRIYLPQADLRRFHLSDSEILGLIYNDNFQRLMKFEADRARALFAAAWAALPPESRRAARPALVMGRLYRRLLDKMERRRFQVFTSRPRLTFVEKIASLSGQGGLE